MFDSLLGRGTRVYHTGGYLGEGGVVSVMAPQAITVTYGGCFSPRGWILTADSFVSG